MFKRTLIATAIRSMIRPMIVGPAGSGPVNVSDVFSTNLWTGNSISPRNITTNTDLLGEGGMVWVKNRDSAIPHAISDSFRPGDRSLRSDSTTAEVTGNGDFGSFTNTGYQVRTSSNTNQGAPFYDEFVGWSFKKAPKFFDVIKYTGDGVAGREIAHELGVQAGLCFIKAKVQTTNWQVQHTTRPANKVLRLNSSGAEVPDAGIWNNTPMSDISVTVGTLDTNVNTIEYIMYVFAHDTEDSGVIQCGSYVGTGAAGNEATLGWKPQYVLIKRAYGGTGNWYIFDTTRGIVIGAGDKYLFANSSNVESTDNDYLDLTETGFTINNTGTGVNANGSDYIYMAIKEA